MNIENKLFIGVSGIIGAGKTTFTRELAECLGYEAYYEPVKENPFLTDFYKDMERWSSIMQLYLLHARFQQHQEIVWGRKGVVQDRTIYEDTIFADILNKSNFMDSREMDTYNLAYSNMIKFLAYPDIIVHLDVEPETAKKRISKRGRDFEKDIPLEYLKDLYNGYRKFIEEISQHTLLIDLDWNDYGDIKCIGNDIRESCHKERKYLKNLKRLGKSSCE